MRILGIDPGSVATGYGVVERRGARVAHVAHGTLRPPRGAALPERLAFLHREVARLVADHRPALVGVERVFAGRGARSALVLGQARGAVLAALAGVAIRELAPQHVKLAVTGTGAAEKSQVQGMVKRLLALAELPPRDAADALAAAICCAQSPAGNPLLRALATSDGSARASRIRGSIRTSRISRVVVRRVP
jgi:crossover junction endodeoxyribonuclease RuvC